MPIPSIRTLSAIVAPLTLGACATPEAQLRTGLANAGLSKSLSTCMAKEMTPKLSVKQLLRLRDLSHVSDRDPRNTSIDKYLHQVRALGDGEIWSVTSRAASHCTIGW